MMGAVKQHGPLLGVAPLCEALGCHGAKNRGWYLQCPDWRYYVFVRRIGATCDRTIPEYCLWSK